MVLIQNHLRQGRERMPFVLDAQLADAPIIVPPDVLSRDFWELVSPPTRSSPHRRRSTRLHREEVRGFGRAPSVIGLPLLAATNSTAPAASTSEREHPRCATAGASPARSAARYCAKDG
jgi:hypothetical protein